MVADDAEAFLVARVRYTDRQGSGKDAEATTGVAVAAVGEPPDRAGTVRHDYRGR